MLICSVTQTEACRAAAHAAAPIHSVMESVSYPVAANYLPQSPPRINSPAILVNSPVRSPLRTMMSPTYSVLAPVICVLALLTRPRQGAMPMSSVMSPVHLPGLTEEQQ